MENATKALLIAVAVIIAIVVIGLALIPLTSGQKLIEDNSDMNDIEVSTYNAKFESYFGGNVSGTKTKQLVKIINQHNKANSDDPSRIITISGDTGMTAPSTGDKTYNTSVIGTGDAYKIEADPDHTNKGYTSGGLIQQIKITKK